MLKFKRLGKGKYVAAVRGGHTAVVEKWCDRCWVVYLRGGYRININYPTMARAKEAVAGLMFTLVAGWEKRQADEASGNLENRNTIGDTP